MTINLSLFTLSHFIINRIGTGNNLLSSVFHPVILSKNTLCLLSLFAAKIRGEFHLIFDIHQTLWYNALQKLRTKQHQKQGELQTMPIQPLHHVSGQESQNPHSSTEFCILTSGFSPIMRNEPCAKLSWCNSAGPILPGQRLAARPE